MTITAPQVHIALESSTLTGLAVDVTARTARLDIHILDGGTERRHTLAFEGLTSFALDRPNEAPWDYTEISELFIEPLAGHAGIVRFWAELWSRSHLEIHAARVVFDGAQVLVGVT